MMNNENTRWQQRLANYIKALTQLEDAEIWMEMINSRNHTLHTYNKLLVEEISGYIINKYCVLFVCFSKKMQNMAT